MAKPKGRKRVAKDGFTKEKRQNKKKIQIGIVDSRLIPDAVSIDLSEIEELARNGCTLEEISWKVGLPLETFLRRIKSDDSAEGIYSAVERGRSLRRIMLRSKQTELAERGNIAMLIWLGKQELDQCEKSVISANLIEEFRALSQDELVKRGREALERMSAGRVRESATPLALPSTFQSEE